MHARTLPSTRPLASVPSASKHRRTRTLKTRELVRIRCDFFDAPHSFSLTLLPGQEIELRFLRRGKGLDASSSSGRIRGRVESFGSGRAGGPSDRLVEIHQRTSLGNGEDESAHSLQQLSTAPEWKLIFKEKAFSNQQVSYRVRCLLAPLAMHRASGSSRGARKERARSPHHSSSLPISARPLKCASAAEVQLVSLREKTCGNLIHSRPSAPHSASSGN